ncbi:sterol desaturase family protein [Effusibacillus consociatus]|uniref:Sterol desaturase family protein n=2 Tax=Effusibacillus consociatus TaxID=1117041 RepID=A0ABV9PYH5_9BACL
MTLLFAGCLFGIAPAMNQGSTWVGILTGVLLWYVSEYTTHRFLFHAPPPKNKWLLRLLNRLHYAHHELPNELHLLFLPVWYSIPNFFIVWLLAYAVTHSSILSFSVVAGGVGCLLYYEWVHFVAHRPIKPRTPWGKWMKKYHLWHHYKNENFWFGVTNPGMDKIMGTYEDEKHVELSSTARKLL